MSVSKAKNCLVHIYAELTPKLYLDHFDMTLMWPALSIFLRLSLITLLKGKF